MCNVYVRTDFIPPAQTITLTVPCARALCAYDLVEHNRDHGSVFIRPAHLRYVGANERRTL